MRLLVANVNISIKKILCFYGFKDLSQWECQKEILIMLLWEILS